MKKIWTKPQVTVQHVGLEITAYLSAEIDITILKSTADGWHACIPEPGAGSETCK